MSKREIIEKMKELAERLSEEYGCNIKIELNVNPKYDSVKVNVTEYNK